MAGLEALWIEGDWPKCCGTLANFCEDWEPDVVKEISPQTKIESLVELLREQRIKKGVDYAITYKYGELRIFCNLVFCDRILNICKDLNLKIHEIIQY